MTLSHLFGAALAASLLSGTALAASVPLSREAIDKASFSDWEKRQAEAEEVAADAQADPTIPAVEEKAPGQEGQAVPSDPAQAAAAAEGVDTRGPAEVEVTGEPDKVVETPANSTDVPDEAGLQAADEPETADPFLVRLQILLDRAHASPGVIDGFAGGNTQKAISAYETMQNLPVDGQPDADLWAKLGTDDAPAVKSYKITAEDVKGPFIRKLPSDYAELAKLNTLAYSGPLEMLAERFHMDEALLSALNPDADFDKAGTSILVAETGSEPTAKVVRIVVDKAKGELVAFDAEGRIVLADPATIGSPDSPSPTGTVEVKGVAPEPSYSYDPSKNFKQGNNAGKLTLPPGPNGPVGSVWIDLSKPTYGIHGTPHPDLIDKAESHGCVRLTNWDAEALAKLVEPSRTVVEFKG